MKAPSIEFTGYEPRPVMAEKMAKLVEMVEALQIEVAKLKAGASEPVKKTSKTSTKTEE